METKAKQELIVLSKDEQKAIAADIFKGYPKAQKVSVASDGQAFITNEGDNAAKSHCKNNRYGKELELTPFTRDGIEGKKATEEKVQLVKAEELVAQIEAATSIEQVNELLGTDTRKTVVAAAKKMIETLNAAK